MNEEDIVKAPKEPRVVHNRLNDVFFKTFFSNKPFLISLLNSIFENYPSGNRIVVTDVEFQNGELTASQEGGKSCRLDLLVKTEQGIWINVEVQVVPFNMAQRSLFYFSKVYERQLKESDKYELLKPCVMISILNFNLKAKTKNFLTRYQLVELREHEVLNEDLDIFFLEIPKWKKAQGLEEVPVKIKNRLFRWLNYLTGNDPKLEEQIRNEDHLFREAHDMEGKFLDNDKLWSQYLQQEMALHDEASKLDYAKNEGREEGIAEGMAKGREEGMAKGKAEGKAEGKLEERFNIVRNLLANGSSTDFIKQCVNISDEEIKNIQMEMTNPIKVAHE